MPSIRQQINQSQLPLPKMKISQHNPYESETPYYMNVNEVVMPQYKPSEVTMLQDKSKSTATSYVSTHAISEATVYQNESSSQKSIINKWSVSQ